MMRNVLFTALPAGLLLIAACSDSMSSGSGGTGAGMNTGSTSSGGTCPDNLADAPNSEFCAADKGTIDCSLVTTAYHDQVCGVPVVAPTEELARSSTVKEYAGSGPPDLGCLAPGGYPTAGTSQTVKVSGLAKIFSHGCESKQVTIEIHTVKRTGGADDGDLGPLVGTAVTTPTDCKTAGVASTEMDCGTRYECTYAYDGVPTETELLILTKGALWAPLYDYNIYIPNSEVQNGVWKHDVRALAADDYQVIPQAAIGTPITAGNGAIAGEVHDCGNVRLQHATVDVNVQRRSLSYFTNNEDHPLPDSSAMSSSTLGLYAALDVTPGPASVAALGLVDGKVTTVGFYKVRVFPDAVTAITFRGVRPYQVTAP